MASLDSVVYSLENDLKRKEENEKRLEKVLKDFAEVEKQFRDGVEAQRVLGSVADERSNRILNFVTTTINKALSEVFPNSVRRIHLERTLHADKYPHINIVLEVENGKTRDMSIQSGSGLGEIVSFLYRLCLIEIRGGRKFGFYDELLRGVHADAMKVIIEIIKIFTEGDFQLLITEYGLPDDFGRTYIIEKGESEARISLYREDSGARISDLNEESEELSVDELEGAE